MDTDRVKLDVKLVIYITSDQKAALDQLHQDSGAPVSELVRRALDVYIRERIEFRKRIESVR